MCVSGQYVYVTDSTLNNVSVFTAEGKYMTSFGGPHALSNPVGLSADQDGFLYVCDHGNNRIQIF